MEEGERDRKNRRIGLWVAAGVHSGMLLVLFFMVAWREPDPPLPEYGIELNFGLDDQGSGEVQPEQPVGDEGQSEETMASESAQAEAPETSDPKEEAVTEKPVEAVSKTESPVTVKEVSKPTTPARESAKPASAPPSKETAQQPKEETSTKPTAEDASRKGQDGSHGDDQDKTGDKGSEQGTLDAKALYGTPGGGGGGTGMNLQMTGWTWADDPTIPQLPDNENGKIVFDIECDENGDITAIKTIERTLSPKAEQLLKDMIRKNSLVRTSGGKVPERSTGRFVFVLKTL